MGTQPRQSGRTDGRAWRLTSVTKASVFTWTCGRRTGDSIAAPANPTQHDQRAPDGMHREYIFLLRCHDWPSPLSRTGLRKRDIATLLYTLAHFWSLC